MLCFCHSGNKFLASENKWKASPGVFTSETNRGLNLLSSCQELTIPQKSLFERAFCFFARALQECQNVADKQATQMQRLRSVLIETFHFFKRKKKWLVGSGLSSFLGEQYSRTFPNRTCLKKFSYLQKLRTFALAIIFLMPLSQDHVLIIM